MSCFETSECSSKDELSKICFSGASTVSAVEKTPGKIKTLKGVNEEENQSSDALCSCMPDGTCFQVNKSSKSRQGRDQQRWDKDSDETSWIRLTTGVVPITNDGRVVFVSSARKKEWILPKGGWESDELLEQSALRESYEEAGLLGNLGPQLSDVCFETRKSKKRRMENQELAKRVKADQESATDDPISCSSSSIVSSEDHIDFSTPTSNRNNPNPNPNPNPSIPDSELCNSSAPPRTEPSQEEHTPKKYLGICRMTLFPLYITEVLDTWPESGRSRKLFSINEAIDMVTRPHLKEVLVEVKQRGLHMQRNLDNKA